MKHKRMYLGTVVNLHMVLNRIMERSKGFSFSKGLSFRKDDTSQNHAFILIVKLRI